MNKCCFLAGSVVTMMKILTVSELDTSFEANLFSLCPSVAL